MKNIDFELPAISEVASAAEAQQLAIDWSTTWQDYQYSYGELAYYQDYFEKLAKNFNLTEEFKENGII